MIYDDSKKVMYMVEPSKKSYIRIDKHFAEQLRDRMNQLRNKGNLQINKAKEQALEKIKHLPPERQAMARKMLMGESIGPTKEQRLKMQQLAMQEIKKLPQDKQAMAKQMMMKMLNKKEVKKKKQIPTEIIKKIELNKTNITKTIKGYKCQVYEKLVEGKIKSKLCISEPSQLGVKNEDFRLIKSMVKFHKEIRESLKDKMPSVSTNNTISQFGLIKGVPLEIIHMDNKRKEIIGNINLESLSPNLFTIPKDFNQKNLLQSIP